MFEQLEQKQPCILLTVEEFFVNGTYTRGEQFYSSRSQILIHIAADTYHRHKCRSNSTHYKKTVGWPPLKNQKEKLDSWHEQNVIMLFRVSFLLFKYFIRMSLNLRVHVVLSALRVYPLLHVQLKPISPKTKSKSNWLMILLCTDTFRMTLRIGYFKIDADRSIPSSSNRLSMSKSKLY